MQQLTTLMPADASAFRLTDAILSLWGAVSVQATYWHVYLAVVLAFLAFMVNNWSKPKHKTAVGGLALGMIIFFAASCYEIYILQDRANQWRQAIYQYVLAHQEHVEPVFLAVYAIEPSLPPAWGIAALHIVLDLALLALLAYNYWSARAPLGRPAEASLKRSANGRPPGPGLRYAVHFLSPGQGVLPPRAP